MRVIPFGVTSLFASTFAALSACAAGEPPVSREIVLESIEIISGPEPGTRLVLKNDGKPRQEIEIGIDQDWRGEAVVKGEGPLHELRMTVAYTNVMSLHDEGPHLDLTDWLTYESGELRVESVRGRPGTFTVDDAYFIDGAFPFITREDLVDAVVRHMRSGSDDDEDYEAERRRWIELARKCTTPQTHPCNVSPHLVRFRVYHGDEQIKEWTLVIALGC